MSDVFAFSRGASRSILQAYQDLFFVQKFCAGINQWGPAGMALAARTKLEAGGSDEDLRVLIRSCILTSRMFRPAARFDFVSDMGFAHGAYCVIAWLLFGVLRARKARAYGPSPIEQIREAFDADPVGTARQFMEHGIRTGAIRVHHVRADGTLVPSGIEERK